MPEQPSEAHQARTVTQRVVMAIGVEVALLRKEGLRTQADRLEKRVQGLVDAAAPRKQGEST